MVMSLIVNWARLFLLASFIPIKGYVKCAVPFSFTNEVVDERVCVIVLTGIRTARARAVG